MPKKVHYYRVPTPEHTQTLCGNYNDCLTTGDEDEVTCSWCILRLAELARCLARKGER